ncbi:MAG TPA: carbon starvation CstA family protein [Gemmataceae bacterium]|nr:carbon starvation CstA family protein [Gemmataceae bacterium]
MAGLILANVFFESESGRTVLRAMPVLLGALCVLAIAYRYYSAFLAARVASLDDSRITPAHRFRDGQNYDPTNRWVLFGHHFAAIAGAGPLIGPVLAIQYGYMPGLLWLVIGVCLAGAVQDMLVLAASVRRGGKSLAEIARAELGPQAAIIVSAAILFIVVIALAGLGFVVVKALGGDDIQLAENTRITLPPQQQPQHDPEASTIQFAVYRFPGGCQVHYSDGGAVTPRSEQFRIGVPPAFTLSSDARGAVLLPKGAKELVPGSSWGTFTIACTIPIALVMGLWMYKIRRGRIGEASILGAVAVLSAVIVGNWIPGSALESIFSLSKNETILALTGYGFIASVLPVWLLLCPRDYLSSFLKIGTVGLIIVGVFMANPKLQCPTVNQTFLHGGPTFKGDLFPFLFICIMCGSVSGFHALVSSGTTPKMIDRESDIRPIGYGAMLMEGLVGIVALITAASLPPDLYYEINTSLPEVPRYQAKLDELYASVGISESRDPLHAANVDSAQHLPVDLASVERMVGGEALRGRTGGAVTLAVGMAFVFSDAFHWTGLPIEGIMKYWYHFAIMFEALFILTTIDAGTRIARFLLQEALGRVYTKFERTDWLPGALLATLIVTAGWGVLIWAGSISTIWPMFGIANQLLAVMALALVTTLLINTGRARYAPITLLPMLFVTSTTLTAGAEMLGVQFPAIIRGGELWKGIVNIALTVFVIACVGMLLLLAVSRWAAVVFGMVPARIDAAAGAEPTRPG